MAIQKEELNERLLPLFSNQEALDKLHACKSPEECYEIAKTYIPEVSFEELKQSMLLLNAYVEEHKDGYLDLEDLDNVAGGYSVSDFLTDAAHAGEAAAGAAAFAAA